MNILEQKSVEQKLQVLQFKNQKLSSQLDSQRRQISSLEEQVSAFEAERKNFNESLLCINRIWDQLNQDIQYLCEAFGANAGVGAEGVKEETKSESGHPIQDPFLRRLIQLSDAPAPDVAEATASVASQLSATEAALTERASATRQSLSNVLQVLQSKHTLFAQAAHAAPDINQELLAERETLGRQVSHYKAQSSAYQAEIKLYTDRVFTAEKTVQDLRNQLADSEERVTVLNKKLFELKNAAQPVAAPAQPSSTDASKPSTSAGIINPGDVAAEVQEMQLLLDKKTAQLDKEKEQTQRLQKQLEEAAAKLNGESWVAHTRVFALKEQENKALRLLLDQKFKELEGMAKERDEALIEAAQKERFALSEQAVLKRVGILEGQLGLLVEAKAGVERVKQELEVQLQRDREKLGNVQTVNELKTMIATLQKENTMLQKQLKQNKVSVDRIEAASASVESMVGQLEAKELALQRLGEQLAERAGELADAKKAEVACQERVTDLTAFVDVLTEFCNDPREVAEVRASEAALKERVARLTAQLEGGKLHQQAAELERDKAALKEALAAAKAECDRLRLETQRLNRVVEGVSEQLTAVRQECDVYKEEIEGAGSAYEDMQGQNSRLLQQLTERDEVNSQLVAERIKLNQQTQGLRGELEAAGNQINSLKGLLADQAGERQSLEKAMTKLMQDTAQAKEQCRVFGTKLEQLSKELQEKAEAAAAMEVRLEAAHKAVAERKAAVEAEADKCGREAAKRQRVEDEVRLLSARCERLKKRQADSESVSELEEEMEAMRKLLNCSVCNSNQKNVIITKCWHMFCQPCIKKNLDARHRKCPGCGVMFGQADVKNFFFT